MTYRTLRIWDYPSDHSDHELSPPARAPEPLLSLDAQAVKCSPFSLAGWAKERGLSIDGPDNCWVRVAVSGDQLAEFVSGMNLDVRLDPARAGRRFVIESEEF